MVRQAKPTVIKRLEARSEHISRGGHVIRVDEIEPSGDPRYNGLPKPPYPLSKQAQKTWDFILQCMANTGIYTTADGIELAYFCELDARFWSYIKDGDFAPMSLVGELRRFSPMFGLDPSARARPSFPGKPESEEEPLSKLRNRSNSA